MAVIDKLIANARSYHENYFKICLLLLQPLLDHPLRFNKVNRASCVQLVSDNHMTGAVENLLYVWF